MNPTDKQARIDELAKRIKDANNAYYNYDPEISDEEFDALKDELKDLDSTHSAITDVGAAVDKSKEHWVKTKHSIPMGSQDKVNTTDELRKWIISRAVGSYPLCVQEKLDGISLSLNYQDGELVSAVTRGNGIIGEDIFRNAIKMKGVPSKLKLYFTGSIRGEVVLFKEDWQKHMPELSNPRNAASGVARRITGGGQEHLTVICYDLVGTGIGLTSEWEKLQVLKNLGFRTPNAWRGDVENVFYHYHQYENGKREALPYEIDGFVIKVDDLKVQKGMGNHGTDGTGNPKGQVALKFAHEMRESIIQNISWEVGLTGRITPLAWIKPVVVAGATISRASLHNISNIKRLGCRLGSRVLVSRRNDVIPYIEKTLSAGDLDVSIPARCPSCDEPISHNGEYIQCDNDECRVAGNIEKWINLMEVDGVGPKVIASIVHAGLVFTPGDLYRLEVSQLSKLERMGSRSAEKIVENIQASKEMPLFMFLAGLNIPNCGRRVFKNIIRAGFDNLEDIRQMYPEEVAAIKGLGDSIADKVVNGLRKKAMIIDDLLDAGVIITNDTGPASTKLQGQTFCFTGSMVSDRKTLEEMVTDNGGEVKSSPRKGMSYLVIADVTSTSSKAVKARDFNIPLISETDFLALV